MRPVLRLMLRAVLGLLVAAGLTVPAARAAAAASSPGPASAPSACPVGSLARARDAVQRAGDGAVRGDGRGRGVRPRPGGRGERQGERPGRPTRILNAGFFG